VKCGADPGPLCPDDLVSFVREIRITEALVPRPIEEPNAACARGAIVVRFGVRDAATSKDLSTECQQRFRRINLRRARRSARPGARPARARVDPHDRAIRQPEAGGSSGRRRAAGRRPDVRPDVDASDNLSTEAVSRHIAKAEVSRIFQDPNEQGFTDREDPVEESATSH
jgi:hypothetical protein